MFVVDVHSHILPPTLVEEGASGDVIDGIKLEREDSVTWVVHRQGFRYPLSDGLRSFEMKLAEMDDLGIDVSILSVAPTLFLYWLNVQEFREFCAISNDDLCRIAEQAGGRLVPIANLPMQDPASAVAEFERCVDLGMPGAMVGPHIEGRPLDHDELRPVLETAARLEAPLVLHPYYVGLREGLEDFYLTNVIGNPLDTTVALSRLIFSGVLDELPQLRIVALHGGGFLPYQIGRLHQAYLVRNESGGCSEAPSSYLRRFYYDTLTHSPMATRYLVDRVGPDRVVLGTDSPFDMGAGSLDDQLGGTIGDPADYEAIGWRNAAELFGLRHLAPTPFT